MERLTSSKLTKIVSAYHTRLAAPTKKQSAAYESAKAELHRRHMAEVSVRFAARYL